MAAFPVKEAEQILLIRIVLVLADHIFLSPDCTDGSGYPPAVMNSSNAVSDMPEPRWRYGSHSTVTVPPVALVTAAIEAMSSRDAP